MSPISAELLIQIIEAALMVAGRPLTAVHLQKLFEETYNYIARKF